jgi:hypothetical protein
MDLDELVRRVCHHVTVIAKPMVNPMDRTWEVAAMRACAVVHLRPMTGQLILLCGMGAAHATW